MLVIVPEFKIIGKMPEKKVKENPWISFFFFFFFKNHVQKEKVLFNHAL